jgi:hypothetical protein
MATQFEYSGVNASGHPVRGYIEGDAPLDVVLEPILFSEKSRCNPAEFYSLPQPLMPIWPPSMSSLLPS